VAVGVLAPLLAVAACSADDPITAQRRAASQGSTAGSTGAAATTPETPTTTADASKPVETALKVQLKDTDLGHVVTPIRMVRNATWPAGNPVAEASFEIIAIEVQVATGSRYSASVQPWMFSLSTTKNRRTAPTTEFGELLGAPLPAANRAEKKKGWLYFKVDRGSESTVTLFLKRPEYKVSTTGKTLPAKSFSVVLAK
jgi:hypothetical protein